MRAVTYNFQLKWSKFSKANYTKLHMHYLSKQVMHLSSMIRMLLNGLPWSSITQNFFLFFFPPKGTTRLTHNFRKPSFLPPLLEYKTLCVTGDTTEDKRPAAGKAAKHLIKLCVWKTLDASSNRCLTDRREGSLSFTSPVSLLCSHSRLL